MAGPMETRINFLDFHWLDLINPTKDRLLELAEEYKLHSTSVQDCLEPQHLPKFESFEDSTFVILRSVDPDSMTNPEADTVRELTRKVAIFYGKGFLITVHRTEQPYLTALLQKWKSRENTDRKRENLFVDLVQEVILTFDKPVLECFDRLESIEEEIFGRGKRRKFKIREGYYLKRKISVFKRMLRASLEPLNQSMSGVDKKALPHYRNVRERLDAIFFNADEISESIASLLNLHISLASQKTNEASRKTNEVMRVLTIFSCFFLPVNFIAGVYGMNFSNLPETKWEHGYYYALGLMASISLAIYFWFRKRGWLKGSQP